MQDYGEIWINRVQDTKSRTFSFTYHVIHGEVIPEGKNQAQRFTEAFSTLIFSSINQNVFLFYFTSDCSSLNVSFFF